MASYLRTQPSYQRVHLVVPHGHRMVDLPSGGFVVTPVTWSTSVLRRRHWPSCSLHGRRRTIVSSVSAPWRSPALNWTKRNMQRRGKSTTHVHIVALSCHRWRSRRSLSDSQTSATAPPVFHLPDACLTTRLDPRATVRKRAGARRETLGWQSARACSRPLLSIAGSDPHTRPNLLEPATPNPRTSRRTGTLRAPGAACGTLDAAEPARLNGSQVRRGGDAAELAIDSMGRRRHSCRRFAVRLPRSSTVAAASRRVLGD